MDNWTMSDERAFIENLLCSRFNFMLVFFGLIVAGGLATNNPLLFKCIFVIGFLVTFLLSLTICRAQKKLDIAINSFLFDENSQHPAKTLNDKCSGRSVRGLIGYIIPMICSTILLMGAVLAILEIIEP